MKKLLYATAAASLVACSPTLRRPVETTEGATQLEQVTRSKSNELDPAVSPDASTLAYESSPAPDAPGRIEVMSLKDVASGASEVAYGSGDATGREPAWIPDGSGLVFVSDAGQTRSLVEMIGHGAGRAPFVAGVGDPTFAGEWPAVSPGGSVAMSVGKVRVFQTGWRATERLDDALGVSDLLGTGLTLLGRGTEPAWSPDGKRLAFVRASGGHAHVFVADGGAAGATQITDGADDDVEPAWSPDGHRIAFCSVHAVDHVPHANLFAVNADGSGLVQLTEGDRVACRPSWGEDGFIYFHANARERFHIWRLRPGP